MQFHSILFDRPIDATMLVEQEPDCFGDLRLDQLLATLLAGRDEYKLAPFFYTPLRDPETVHYRHAVARDLEDSAIFAAITTFTEQMRRMRRQLTQATKLFYPYQKAYWFLDAVATYCGAVNALTTALPRLETRSSGLQAFGDYLSAYRASSAFVALEAEAQSLRSDLANIQYCVHIQGNRVTVTTYQGESDYSAEVVESFAKFEQTQEGATKDYRVKFKDWPEMNHVEAHILDLVARLNSTVFQALSQFGANHRDYLDPTVSAFDREIQVYLAYQELIARFQPIHLPFCYPDVSTQSKETAIYDTCDLALASALVTQKTPMVRNDVTLQDPERILVITGPNQGGKSTFARMVGQVHYLASLGLAIPGAKARVFLPDHIFTHFEREEDLATLHGKLEDEVVRIHAILEQATGDSLIIMNESFASTTLQDSLYLGEQVLQRILKLGALAVYVTFVDELASLDERVVSLVGLIGLDTPGERTYKIVRRPADGRAYALAIAEKYGLTYDTLRERVDARTDIPAPAASTGSERLVAQ